jgi:hypothetical protein
MRHSIRALVDSRQYMSDELPVFPFLKVRSVYIPVGKLKQHIATLDKENSHPQLIGIQRFSDTSVTILAIRYHGNFTFSISRGVTKFFFATEIITL